MYIVYYTNPHDKPVPQAHRECVSDLINALQCCEYLRSHGMLYVTLVSDYDGMIGKPGAQMAGVEYVPQLKN